MQSCVKRLTKAQSLPEASHTLRAERSMSDCTTPYCNVTGEKGKDLSRKKVNNQS
jgi:hypothetical protein